MARLRLTLACGDYDRTRALEDETVRPDGIELTYVRLPPEEIFFRMMRHQEFEVAELSLSSYVVSLQHDPPPFVAIPVFPSRSFRHTSMYVNAAAGITAPADLAGAAVGTPEFQLTAGVWARGILAEHHDLPVAAVTHVTGGQERPGRVEKAAVSLPDRIRITAAPAGTTLSALLADGGISALCTPRIPSPFAARDPRVRRLFPDVVAAERAYYRATGIFPIMHVVAVRSDVHRRWPWVAQSLVQAFARAKDVAREALYDSAALPVMLPWLVPQLEDAEELMGRDYWSYGLPANRHTLQTFLRYHHEQGLSPRQLTPDELFAREALESAVV